MYFQDFQKCNGSTDKELHSTEPDNNDIEFDLSICLDDVVMRKRVKKRRSTTRRSVINGHLFDAEVMWLFPVIVICLIYW